MMKSRKKAILFTGITLLWTAVIFSFSLQPAQESANLSGGLLRYLLGLFYGITGLEIPVSIAHFLIRKTAHFCEFFLLGVFAFQACKHLMKKWWFALLYGVAVAITDEVIQFFTGSGRAMRVSDMLLDTAGVGAAILLVAIITIRKHKETRN